MARNPKAEVQITAESKTLGAKLRGARAEFARFGGALRKEVFGKLLFDGPKASAHMVGQLGAQAASRGFGFIEDQAKGVLEFNKALLNFQLAARRTPEEAQALGQAARQIAVETSTASETVLAGEKAFIDLAGAENYSEASMRTLARTARASNTEISAMATVMYALQNSLHVNPAEMEDTLSGLINQSKDGTIHFANMAEEIIGIAPKFARFGVTGREGAIQLGAMFQVIRSGSKGAEETTTKMDGIFRGLIKNSKLFRKAGVEVFNVGKDGVKHLKPFEEIWAQLAKPGSKLMKDPSKMIKTFGRGDGEAGMRLLIEQKKKYEDLVEAGRKNGTVTEDLAAITESAGGRMATAMERVKNSVAEAFTPERINGFVTAIEGLADKVGPIAEMIGAIGTVLGGLSGIGKFVRGSLSAPDEEFRKSAGEAMTALDYYRSRGFAEDSPEVKRALFQYNQRQANLAGFNRTRDEIMGGEVNERSTPESIRRAVLAEYSDQNAPGGAGRIIAAMDYLKAAGVTKAQQDEILKKAAAGAATELKPYMAAIIEAIKQGFAGAKTEVKADGKAIVDVHRGSSKHATRPGG